MTYALRAAPMAPVDETLIAEAIRFADEKIAPQAREWDRGESNPEPVLREAIGRFTGTAIPTALGGRGSNYATLTRIYEELSRRDLGFTCSLAVHTNVTVAMSLSENVALRDRVLPGLLSGEKFGAFLLTEPEVGSDATAISTHAAKSGDGFAVTGRKAWVTNGRYADVLAVFCQTEPGTGAKGIAAFVIDAKAAGVTIEKQLDLVGSHAMGTTDVTFEGAAVGADAIAFPIGGAFKAAMFGIAVARLGVAGMVNGALASGLDAAIDYGSQRNTFGKPVTAHQAMAFILSDTATDLEASRSLTFQAAACFDAGSDPAVLVAHAKKYATKTAFAGISEAMRALGANGLKRDFPLARQLAAARVAECMDGTGEIQNIVISRQLGAA